MKYYLFTFLLTFISSVFSASVQNSNDNEELLKPGPLGAEVCMQDLGCFKMTEDFFHPEYRPFNFLPEDRETIGTEFQLYTKKSPMESTLVKHNDLDSLREVDPSLRTIFIVHGFIDSNTANRDSVNNAKWMRELKTQLLLSDNYNVIIVDWSRGNQFPYTRATANTRVVGAEIALLIQSLKKSRGLDPLKVHIIGHSLGSHIAGYAGQRLQKLGRITGLDPAGPYFQHMPPSVRLDPTDAEFVDVIHTDSVTHVWLAVGMMQACGHIDFYPNNGQKQPGCDKEAAQSIFLEGLVDASRRFVCCSHLRANDYFIYSINYKQAQPVGFQCESWQHYLLGLCTECHKGKCVAMGMNADQFIPYKNDSQSIKVYLATSSNEPFWEYTYQLAVALQHASSETTTDAHGSVNVIIDGARNDYNITFGPLNLSPGFTYTYLVREIQPLGDLKGLTFKWTSSSHEIFNQQSLYVREITITPMNTADAMQQNQQTKRFCNKDLEPFYSDAVIKMELC